MNFYIFPGSSAEAILIFLSRHLSAESERPAGEPEREPQPDHAAAGRVAEPVLRVALHRVRARGRVAGGLQDELTDG